MNKLFLLSLLYFVSCQLNCSDTTIFPTKPENCFERKVDPTLGTKCCFSKGTIVFNGLSMTQTLCNEIPKEYTDEMLKQLIEEQMKNIPEGFNFTFNEFSCPKL